MMRTLVIVVVAGIVASPKLGAQTADKTSAEFEVASVKPNNSGSQTSSSSFPLGPGDVYVKTGGAFSSTNLPLLSYISFAYKIRGNQLQSLVAQLPPWVSTDRFDIQAKATGNPDKDQMRLMMRSLLAERFKAIRNETREVPVLALVPVKPGKTGPRLRPHPDNNSCETTAAPPAAVGAGQRPYAQTIDGGFPVYCTAVLNMTPSVAGRRRVAGRNVTLEYIAESLSASSNLGRPMVDQTGIKGTVDFILEWEPDRLAPSQAGADSRPDVPSGSTFQSALREQLGLKLESQKAKVDLMVVDHIEHPSEN